ncbi:hypothetical protein F4780DRAFT_786489 [Xylariomycetidae sp. FL0641]|nr:hypothetical protein F4780DRAFT_786489 [Xylariomycetidae sp. FL0641]
MTTNTTNNAQQALKQLPTLNLSGYLASGHATTMQGGGNCPKCHTHYKNLKEHVKWEHLGLVCLWAPTPAERCYRIFGTERELAAHITNEHPVSKYVAGKYQCGWGQGCDHTMAKNDRIVRHVRHHQRDAWEREYL